MGEEAFFIDQISTFIETSVLDETQRGFDQTTIYGKDTSIDAIVSSAKRFPMLAERQVIVVKEAQNLSRTIEDLLPYVKNPQHTTTLVICYKYKSIDKRKALYKALSKAHVVFESKKIYDSKIPSWISGELQKMNLKITPKASYLLSEFLGNDLAKISNELSKLQLVMGDNDLITPELIQINIGISKDFNNFELQKAIAQLDQKKAYQIVRYFSENPNQHPMVLTVATLYSFFSKLMILHTVNDRNPKVLSRAIGVNPYFLNDYTAAAKNFPMRRISSVFQTLRTIDVKSKGVGANLKPLDLYQELIFRILS
jgi:DNA polymerase-3 subunit delta